MAAQDRTRTRTSGESPSRASRSVPADEPTPVPAATDVVATSATTDRTATSVPPSPRNGVAINVETTRRAFYMGTASQSVAFVQEALRARGGRLGRTDGVPDQETRVALAWFQDSIGEESSGLPTARSLDHLGFTVVG
jgi:hypothetical protein